MKRGAIKAGLLLLAIGSIVFTTSTRSQADVRLPGFFADHMVLQRDTKIKVWGWADPGESVAVSLGDHRARTRAKDDGTWSVNLPAMAASSEAHTIEVVGNNSVTIKDVLIGEVWLCSGQSNMEWRVQQSTNAEEEIAAANYPLIRHMKVAHRPSTVPLDDIPTEWQVCSPDTVAQFTGVGYFMARHLHQELDVPVGLINSSWGGTRVEPWTTPVGFEKVDALQDIYQSVIGRTPGTENYESALGAYIASIDAWTEAARTALGRGESVEPSPAFPAALTPFKSHQDPTMLYNGMIHALVGYPMRGAIWYQGESNHAEGMLYYEKKKALINGWREIWGQGDFPFYFVQIAPYQYGNEDPTILARFWEAQAAVTQLPNTGMVVINDIATLNDIHPPNKQDVGKRLALLALKNDYGNDDVVANSPEFHSLETMGGSLKVTFSSTGGGLMTRDGNPPTHFEIIGVGSNGFQAAEAKIDGDSVILSSDAVDAPVAFRFAWHKLAEPNLAGGTGLPVGACRGGEEPEFKDTVPGMANYQLVYDLDLANLGDNFRYDVDHSESISAFDRIGYLLELRSQEYGEQNLFVSMDAFTDDIKKIGIPVASVNATFQQRVESLDIVSDVQGIPSNTGVASGNIEFWPHNYSQRNAAGVAGALSSIYDCGDEPVEPRDGYGCMQIHDFGAKQTLFAINHWKQGGNADIGIGNSSGDNRDWTFSGNAKSYESKRLRIFVRPN